MAERTPDFKFINHLEERIVEELRKLDQEHIIREIPKFNEAQREIFLRQFIHLDKIYPGGLKAYCQRAQQLLKNSKEQKNPHQGYTPEVPKGEKIDFYDRKRVDHLEAIGREEVRKACFVLVAGGLGERLGYNGIKVNIPVELVTQKCFLQYYIEYILAFQEDGEEIPLAIMTSDDTEKSTIETLEKNHYFGMKKHQIIIMKQEKVPALLDNDAHIALIPGKLLFDTQPHGHGDVHTLLYQHDLPKIWTKWGKQWLIFFQDTNPLCFRAIPTVLGVSKELSLELNSVTVPRQPGEAVGAICKLTKNDGTSITMNVEYNQLDGLLKDTIGQEPVDEKGFSIFPGNINTLVFSLAEYNNTLEQSKGSITEFINPKYADSGKNVFQSATRLECMMQEYPKLLKDSSRVGITQLDRKFCFTTVKNDLKTAADQSKQNLPPESAGSAESDFYWLNAEMLRMNGADIPLPLPEFEQEISGIQINMGAKIVLHPSFGVTLKEIGQKLQGQLFISNKSTFVVSGRNLYLEDVQIDGFFELNGTGHVQKLLIDSKDYQTLEVVDVNSSNIPEFLQIRGFQLQHLKNE